MWTECSPSATVQTTWSEVSSLEWANAPTSFYVSHPLLNEAQVLGTSYHETSYIRDYFHIHFTRDNTKRKSLLQ